jgi:hypothetical protein
MKSITFTVQIQADYPKGSGSPLLCHEINTILTKYDGVTGGAQIIPAPRNIRINTTPND